jgi:hypothetical protein
MKNILRLEELAMFGLSVYLFNLLDFAWWVYPVLLLVPDLGMVGYLLNPRAGAFSYNLAHHKGLALLVYLLGIGAASPVLQLAGIILFGHASMDRIFGYGLKYPDSFQHTHLGYIGKQGAATT